MGLVRRLAWSALVLQMVLVVTGAAVRLTGSGLGCPTWPTCTSSSVITTRALGINGLIEDSNRSLAVVMEVVAVLLVLSVRRHAPHLYRLALVQALFVPVQAIIGGLLVLSGLNPYVLIIHFLASFPLVLAAALLLQKLLGTSTPNPMAARLSVLAILAVTAVLGLGALVTGTGPHAGDRKVHRLSLNPRDITVLHADAVYLLGGLVLALVITTWSTPLRNWALALLGLLVAQGGIGYWQYFTGVPAFLVGMHVAGATLIFTCAAWLFLISRPSGAPPPQTDQARPRSAAGTVTAR